MLSIIASCIILFGFVTSESYPVILFPFTYPPDELSMFAKLSIDTDNGSYTTITHRSRSIVRPAGSNMRFSKEFPIISGIFIITLTKIADVVMEIRESRRSYIFNIQSLEDLGKEYVLISSSEISHGYTCRVSSKSTKDIVVNIRVPPRIQHGLKLNGSCSRSGHCLLKTDMFIEIESRSPLYQTIIASSDEKLIIFCKDDSIFQVFPKINCGTTFQMACPMFNSTNVSNCTVKINNVQSRRQYITINRSIHSVTNFFEIPLEKGKSLNIQSAYEICVLFLENYYDDSGNSVTRSQMLSSKQTQSTLSTSETTSSLVNISESNQAFSFLTTIIKSVKMQGQTRAATESKSSKGTESNRTTDALSINTFYKNWMSVSPQQYNNISRTGRYIDIKPWIGSTLPSLISKHVNPSSEDLLRRKKSTTLPIISSEFMNPTSKNHLPTRYSTPQSTFFSEDSSALSSISSKYVNPFSKDRLLRKYITTNNNQNYTTVVGDSRKICNCICSSSKKHIFNTTRFTDVDLHELIQQLRVNKYELSSEIRKISCADDGRASAKGVGYVGAVVIILVMATIVSFDLINLFQKCARGH